MSKAPVLNYHSTIYFSFLALNSEKYTVISVHFWFNVCAPLDRVDSDVLVVFPAFADPPTQWNILK